VIVSGLIAVAQAEAIRPERVLILVVLAAIGAALPLSAAIRVLRHPRDAQPLDIDSNYSKEDRFFATSFDSRVSAALGPAPRQPGPYAVVFRDPEVIDTVTGSLTIEKGHEPESIVDVHDDLIMLEGSQLAKEAIVGRDAVIGQGSSIRALKSGRNIDLHTRARVGRWIDAGGTIHSFPFSDLGIRATALTSIVLASDVVFRLLAAPVISVGEPNAEALPPLPETTPIERHVGDHHHRIRADGALLVQEPFEIPAGTVCRGDLIVRGDVKIGDGAVIEGSIHSDRDVVVGARARVTGSVIAERHVVMEERAIVEQHVVAHGRATLRSGARVGNMGTTMTLLADEHVELAWHATIYGRIVTYGEGTSTSPADKASRA